MSACRQTRQTRDRDSRAEARNKAARSTCLLVILGVEQHLPSLVVDISVARTRQLRGPGVGLAPADTPSRWRTGGDRGGGVQHTPHDHSQ